MATLGPDLVTTTVLLPNNATVSSDLGPALNASTMVFQDGHVAVAATMVNGSVMYFESSDLGASYSTHQAGHFAAASESDLFRSIGGTSLTAPGGIPGQISSAVSLNRPYLIYTSSVNGVVEAFFTSSSENGTLWTLSEALSAGVGSVLDPMLSVSPVGYLYGTWRENTNGTFQPEVVILGTGGQVLEEPTPLSLAPTEVATGVQGPSVTIDDLERPVFAWAEDTSTGDVLRFASGYLPPLGALAELNQSIASLPPEDFANSTNASVHVNRTLLEDLLSQVLFNLTVNGFPTPGHVRNALRILETEFYPRVTQVPLVLICTGAHNSCRTQPGEPHQSGSGDDGNGTSPVPATNLSDLIINASGPFSPDKYLAVYTDWVLEALGAGVIAPNPDDPSLTSSGNTLTVNPVVDNSITVELDLSAAFQVAAGTVHGHYTGPHNQLCFTTTEYDNRAVSETTGVWLNRSTPRASATSSSGMVGVFDNVLYLSQLRSTESYSWSVLIYATYENFTLTYNSCTEKTTSNNLPGATVRLGPLADSVQVLPSV